jgi:hypothetical protein
MNWVNQSFLDANRFYVESYSQKDPPRKMSMRDKERLLEIVREEFQSNASPDLWCGPCASAFILNAYVLYDEYLKNESSK